MKARIDGLFAEPAIFVAAAWTADLAALRTLLRALVPFGIAEALPGSVTDPVAPEAAASAVAVSRRPGDDGPRPRSETRDRRDGSGNASPPTPPPADPDAAAAAAAAAIQGVVDRTGRALRHTLGEDMPLTPLFGFDAATAAEVAAAATDPIASGPLAIETWLQSLSRIRDAAGTLAWVASGAEWLLGAPLDMVPVQTPRAAGDPWIGGAFGAATLPGDVLSVMTVTPPANPAVPLAGLMLDDWSEIVPGDSETTGLAFHFDRPNAAPPQALLLAVSPTLDGALGMGRPRRRRRGDLRAGEDPRRRAGPAHRHRLLQRPAGDACRVLDQADVPIDGARRQRAPVRRAARLRGTRCRSNAILADFMLEEPLFQPEIKALKPP